MISGKNRFWNRQFLQSTHRDSRLDCKMNKDNDSAAKSPEIKGGSPHFETQDTDIRWWETAGTHLDMGAIIQTKPESSEQFIGNEYFTG